MAKRAYKYRFYPTNEQAKLLTQTFGCVRFVYNTVLRYRTDAYYDQKKKVSYLGANATLTSMKQSGDFPWLNDVSCVPLQQHRREAAGGLPARQEACCRSRRACLRHQQAAFKNFFEGRAEYPAFKKKNNRQAAEFTKSAFKYRDAVLSRWCERAIIAAFVMQRQVNGLIVKPVVRALQ